MDPLIGLKENVIIGKLIPAGTGMKRYRDVSLSTDYQETDEFSLDDDMDYDDIDDAEDMDLDIADDLVVEEDFDDVEEDIVDEE